MLFMYFLIFYNDQVLFNLKKEYWKKKHFPEKEKCTNDPIVHLYSGKFVYILIYLLSLIST